MTSTQTNGEQPLSTSVMRAAMRAPAVERSQRRSAQRVQQVVDAGRRLVVEKGSDFTTQELAKEAGIAVQTLYKHFPSKDHVILAVLEHIVAQAAATYEQQAAHLTDPVARLRSYIQSMTVSMPAQEGAAARRFVAAEHWRLAQLYPDELAAALRPTTELLRVQLVAAVEAGSLHSSDPAYDAWLATQLLQATFHHYTFAASDDGVEDLADRLWRFCCAGWGGAILTTPPTRGDDHAPRPS